MVMMVMSNCPTNVTYLAGPQEFSTKVIHPIDTQLVRQVNILTYNMVILEAFRTICTLVIAVRWQVCKVQ